MPAETLPAADHGAGMDVQPRFTLRHGLWLIAATLLAAALRMWHLGEWSVWVDEGYTWRDATLPLEGGLSFFSTDRANYPLAFLMLRGLRDVGLTGDDEFSLRLPFALLGIASVPLLALCGRRLVGPTAAVIAALLCAVHPWHIFWSQNARGYMLVFVASIVVVDRAVRWTQYHRKFDVVLGVLALLVAALSHPTGLFLGVGVGAFVLLRPFAGADGHRLLLVAGITIAVVIAGSVLFAKLSPYQEFMASKAAPEALHFLQTVAYYFRPALLLAGLAGLVLGGLWWSSVRGLLVTCLLLAPFIVLLAIGGSLVKATARYAFCTMPMWLLLAGRTCAPWFAGLRVEAAVRLLPAAAVVAIVGLDLVTETFDYHGAQLGQRADWRQACAFAATRAGDGPLRLVTMNQSSAEYYLRRDVWMSGGERRYPGVAVWGLTRWNLNDGKADEVQLHEPGGRNHLHWQREQAAAQHAALVVLVSLPELGEIDGGGAFWRALQDEFELALYLPCWVGPKDESLYVFVPRKEGG